MDRCQSIVVMVYDDYSPSASSSDSTSRIANHLAAVSVNRTGSDGDSQAVIPTSGVPMEIGSQASSNSAGGTSSVTLVECHA